MKISENWLREWINPAASTQQIADRLVMGGLELEIEPVLAELPRGVVVGRIAAIVPHPDAERLQICQVDVGEPGKPLSIVCGAANARAGLLAPCALPGAKLPGGLEIKVSSLRGVESSGMLCSAKELGLADRSDGLMELDRDARPGRPIEDYFGFDDRILNLELTPNRGDCLSVQGLAREIAALFGLPLGRTRIKPQVVVGEKRFAVEIENLADCSSFAGRVITKLNPKARTPDWMRERLRRSGVRSLHPLVDITNYVMLELGQPLHAYDAAKLSGTLRVRRARDGEKLRLLNEQEIECRHRELLIADDRGALSLAGVMGGAASAVSGETGAVFFESACFAPQAVAGTGRRHKIASDALYRFERGVDPELQRVALERATELATQICGGEVGPIGHVGRSQSEPVTIHLRHARLVQLLGQEISVRDTEALLARLNITLVPGEGRTWNARVPSYRYDLRIEADLIEEVARLYGYDQIPARPYAAALAPSRSSESQRSAAQIVDVLVARGWQETVSLAFAEPRVQRLLAPQARPVTLDNPLADTHSQMRATLWVGLIAAWSHNRARQIARVRLFESGVCFEDCDGTVVERARLSGLAAGAALAKQWGSPTRPVDFFDVKADVVALFGARGVELGFVADVHDALHPGQSARLRLDGRDAGWLGRLHPRLVQALDLPEAPLLFELELDALRRTRVPAPGPVSEYPSSRRDLSLLVPEALPAQRLCDAVKAAGGETLTQVSVFDVYHGPELGQARKSLSLELIFQDCYRTLTVEEVDASMRRIALHLQEQLGVVVRE